MDDLSDDIETQFPKLRDSGYAITSPEDAAYNCAAFAAGDYKRWWEIPYGSPKHFWPPGIDDDETVDGWERAFKMLNYEKTDSAEPEDGFDRIAIYGVGLEDARHVAVQLDGSGWKSKLGEWNDISHQTLESLSCPDSGGHVHDDNCYGRVFTIMKRRSHKALTGK